MKRVGALSVLSIACAALVLPVPAGPVERTYSGLFYPPLQRALTSCSNLVPFAWLDVLLVGLPLLWLGLIARDLRRSSRRMPTLMRWTLRTAVAVAALYLTFLATWGLNYRRLPLASKLHYDAGAVTAGAVRDAAQLTVSRLNALYAAAHAPDAAVAADRIDGPLAGAFARATKELGAPGTTVPARPKRTLLNFYFRPAGIAGMTDPFFLETLVENDLLQVERPFVIAHEWSHLAGFADEGDANFAGWLTCMRGGPPAQYSGWLFLFSELVNGVPRRARPDIVARLDAGPRADLRAIATRLARDVNPRLSAAGWRVYDQYLKANRIEAGASSYAQVIRLVLGTRIGLSARGSASPAR